MIVEKNKVISFHYTLKNDAGDELESSKEHEPMRYLHGANNIISGLEKAMEGRAKGAQFSTVLKPEVAYGMRIENNVQRIPIKHLKGQNKIRGKIKPGQILRLQTKQGPVQVTVLKVGRFNVDVDGNHPLAGQTLTFEVEITEIREASAEETKHGHAHGPA